MAINRIQQQVIPKHLHMYTQPFFCFTPEIVHKMQLQ